MYVFAKNDLYVLIFNTKLFSLLHHCQSRTGDLQGALASSEMALMHDISVNNKTGDIKLSLSVNVLEQYAIACSKTSPPDVTAGILPRLALSAPHKIEFVESVLKTIQRAAPAAYMHQLVVVENLLVLCDSSKRPIKHARALVEKAKVLRFVDAPPAPVVSEFRNM